MVTMCVLKLQLINYLLRFHANSETTASIIYMLSKVQTYYKIEMLLSNY